MAKVGKIDLEVFTKFVLSHLGAENKKVLVPPLTGVDACVIDIGNDKVLITAEDPIFPAPGLPLETFGWFTVHIGASDVAVMGVKPEFMTYSLLMPLQTEDKDLEIMVDSIHRAAKDLDIAIVGGHTGYYPAVTLPIIGGISVFAIARKDEYVTPAGAKVGDRIILTKGPAIEAAGLLSVIYEKKLLYHYPKELVDKAKGLCNSITVVKDCLVAKQVGGVTAMHDATEGGVIGGLFEVANASDVGMEVDESLFIYPPEVDMICDYLKIDALEAIGEGSLLICVSPERANMVVSELKKNNIDSSIIGRVTDKRSGRFIKRIDGSKRELEIPKQDPFWPAFFKGLGEIG
ncbi:MAG TPA: AIR synthase family protein [candidate division Zixibacteria bacterium]